MFKPKGGGIKGLGGGGGIGGLKRTVIMKPKGISGLGGMPASAPVAQAPTGGSKYVNLEVHFQK